MNNTSLSEKSLIENCINGNRKSQKELYDRLSPKMFAICLRYTENQTEAENMLQNGFLKVFNNLHRFCGNESFEGWVKRIFVKIALTSTRQTKIQFDKSENFEEMTIVNNTNAFDSLYREVSVKTPEKFMENAESVFKLYAVEGYAKKAAIDAFTLTPGAATSEQLSKGFLASEIHQDTSESKNKKMSFSYTIQAGDYKRLNKKGILTVYNLSQPVHIPVIKILGKWRKEHAGVTLIVVNDRWCIKGGVLEHSIIKHVAQVPFSLNPFKRLVW